MSNLPEEFQKIRSMLGEIDTKRITPEARESIKRMKESFDNDESRAQLLTNALDLIKTLDNAEMKTGNKPEETSGSKAVDRVGDFDSRSKKAAHDPTAAVEEFLMAVCVIMSVSHASRRRYIADLLKTYSSDEQLEQLKKEGVSPDDIMYRQLKLLDDKVRQIAQVIEETWKDMDNMTT